MYISFINCFRNRKIKVQLNKSLFYKSKNVESHFVTKDDMESETISLFS